MRELRRELVRWGDVAFVGGFAAMLLVLCVQMYFSTPHTPDPAILTVVVMFAGAAVRGFDTPRRYGFGGQPDEKPADQTPVKE